MPNDARAVYTKPQVCKILSVHIATLNRLIAAGEIEVVEIRPGRRGAVRITQNALDDYLRRNATRRGQGAQA